MACLRRIAGARLDDLRRFLLVDCVETYLELDGRDAEELESLQARGNAKRLNQIAEQVLVARSLEEMGLRVA